MAADGDGPYACRKCGDSYLTVSMVQCPACLDRQPWFPPSLWQDKEVEAGDIHGDDKSQFPLCQGEEAEAGGLHADDLLFIMDEEAEVEDPHA